MKVQVIILTLLVAISGVISKGNKPMPPKWLVLTGGSTSGSNLASSEIVNFLCGCADPVTIPALPAETSKGQSVWVKKTLVFCGGAQVGQNATDTCWSIDKPGETDWTSFPTMTSARALFSLTIMNNKPDQLLAVGGVGDDGTCLDTMEQYTFGYNNWKELPVTLPEPTCGQCAVRLGKKTVMIIGGAPAFNEDPSQIVPTNLVWKINLNKHKKIKKPVKPLQVLPVPLWRPACARRDGFVYVSGGLKSDGTASEDVYEYNIKTNTWSSSPIGTLHTARYGHVMGSTAADQMVVAGGYNANDGILTSIEDTYNNGETWTERRQTLGEAREYAAMAPVSAFIFNCD